LNLGLEGVRYFTLPSQLKEAVELQTAAPKPQIVLIEDNRADVGLVREALAQHHVDCDVTVIGNGEMAFRFIDEIDAGRQKRPDLVIVDLNLPMRPGKEVLKHMRGCSACKDVPVVILTSSDNQRDKDDVAPFSPLHYIKKPSKLDDFLSLGALFKQIVHDRG
jgi:two-component system, chemotaxis family, response regulator Rcp1